MSRGYPLCWDLYTFAPGVSSPAAKRAAVESLCIALTEIDAEYLAAHRTPSLYQSGVRYRKDTGGVERQWWDVPKILAMGFADCKGLAAWRAAELLMAGVPAEPFVTESRVSGTLLYHVRVRTPDGLEDPSRVLGMR